MDWTSWSQTWSTKSTTTTSRRPLRRRRKHLRWKRMYLLLRTDQRLKQKHKDLPLFAHLQELHLFVKEYGLILNQELNPIRHTQWQKDWILFFGREEDGAIEFWRLKDSLRNDFENSQYGSDEVWKSKMQEAEATRKDFNVVLTRQDKKFFISELFKDIQDAIPLILHTPGQCVNSGQFLRVHLPHAINLHSITNSGLIAGRQISGKERQTVFSIAVNPMDKELKDPYKLDLTNHVLRHTNKRSGKDTKIRCIGVDIQLAQRKGLKFFKNKM